MKPNQRLSTLFLGVALGLGFGTPAASAQDPLADTLYLVGTTIADEGGTDWAFMTWLHIDIRRLQGRTYAVYAKPGAAADAIDYELLSVVQTQTSPVVINSLLQQSLALGEDLEALSTKVDAIYESIMGLDSFTLAEKLSAIIQHSEFDLETWGMLVFLARTHPGVALCLGTGYAAQMDGGGTWTYEFRECVDLLPDPDTCENVLGRVTVEAGKPVILEAPGVPVQVPHVNSAGVVDDSTPRNHLNINLRWSTPDALRRQAVLVAGTNIYRATRARAESEGWDVAPPLAGEWTDHLEDFADVAQVNRLPILPTTYLDAVEAADLSDPNFFYTDDNDPTGEGSAFQDGDEYYYFVTAVDVLGRDGDSSPGLRVLICDRIPPIVPKELVVTNEYGYNPITDAATQYLKVEWSIVDETEEGPITEYRIYRFDSPRDVPGGNGTLVGKVPHDSSVDRLSFVDTSIGGTNIAPWAGQTYWFGVTAVDTSACGGNESGVSAIAFGVLRDREGPPPPRVRVTSPCWYPCVTVDRELTRSIEVRERPFLDPIQFFDLSVTPVDERSVFARAEFYYLHNVTGQPVLIASADWPEVFGPLFLDVGFPKAALGIPLENQDGLVHNIGCRLIALDGKQTPIVYGQLETSDERPGIRGVFFGQMINGRDNECPTLPPRTEPCDRISTVTPGSTERPGIDFEINITPTTEEWRLYRRINDGPLTLIADGLASYDEVTERVVQVSDQNLPYQGGRVCYFAVLLDEHGNASERHFIDCFNVTAIAVGRLPTKPLLEPIRPNEDGTRATITWYHPPYNITRFNVYISRDGGSLGDNIGAPLLYAPTVGDTTYTINDEIPDDLVFRRYQTAGVPEVLQPVGPEFSLEIDFELGDDYFVWVEAVNEFGQVSQPSNLEQVRLPVPDLLDSIPVPWPYRNAPALEDPATQSSSSLSYPAARAYWLPNVFPTNRYRQPGILIGTAEAPFRVGELPEDLPTATPGDVNPMTFLFQDPEGERLFPIVAYRFQVPNNFYGPNEISGDVYQVTPYMERIANRLEVNTIWGAGRVIYDPFVVAFPRLEIENVRGNIVGLFLLDTQPVVAGARYKYVLVRFLPNGEIDKIIATNEVDIP